MSIFALPGHKVIFTGYHVDASDVRQLPLTVGSIYTVKETTPCNSYTWVKLEEVRGSFNSIHFDSVVDQTPLEDAQHPTFIRVFGDRFFMAGPQPKEE